MELRPVLEAASVIAAVPQVALALLGLTGAAAIGPVVLAMAAVAAGAMVLAYVWVHDMDRLSETLRHAAREDRMALAHAAAAPRLPRIERMTRSIERLSRSLADRAAQVGAALRANKTIIERLPDPLLVLNEDRTPKRTNAAARAAFGADIGAVLRHPGLRTAIDLAWRDRTTQTASLHLPAPVAREVKVVVIFLEPRLADGSQALVLLSDRSRERAMEQTRADFVANASHELRTPLASLIGFIETLRGPAADDAVAQQRFLGIMADQAQRMNRLIDDLLSLSRIELTEHQAPSEQVDLPEIVTAVLAGFEPRIAERGMVIEPMLDDAVPDIIADADQMAQVVTNLVDNAVKYGRPGGRICVGVAPAPPGGRWPARPGVVLTVTDDGPGIPRADLPRLTERFYRVNKARSRGAGGTGLGLAIIKHITNRHRGQLTIESEDGKGASFSVWLPVGPEK